MPRQDGTGPMGLGSLTGKGLGVCVGANPIRNGIGRGSGINFSKRRGFGRGYGRCNAIDQNDYQSQKSLLLEERGLLQNRLKVIERQLEHL